MTGIGRFAAFVALLLATLSVGWSTPASAQNTVGQYRAALDAQYLEIRALWGELDRFQPARRYCLPPGLPSKAEDQAKLDELEQRVNELTGRYNSLKQSLKDFLGANQVLYRELLVDGVDPRDDRWWRRYDNNRKRMLDELARKKAALAAAPEVDCRSQPKQQGNLTTGPSGPATAPPPAPPAQPSEPQPPTYQPVSMPTLPKHFCSEADKLAFLQSISAESAKANENAKRAGMYQTDVNFTILGLENSGRAVPASLRAHQRRADSELREHQRKFDELHRRHQEAAKIPVIDCRTPQQEPPRQEMRTGQAPPPRQPQAPGLSGADERGIAAQQLTIDSFEAALVELESLLKEGKCGQAWDLVEELDEELDYLESGTARPILGGSVNIPPPRIPASLINQWDERIDDLLDDCPRPGQPKSRLDVSTIIGLHNGERAKFGYAPLRWSIRLANNAQAYANQLASTGQRVHASRAGRGIERENLSQGLIGWDTNKLVASWLNERAYFRAGAFPDVSTTGDWYKVGHYSQVIWPTTTSIGCGLAYGSGYSWLVCRYSPGGNKDGKSVGLPHTIANDIAPANSSTPADLGFDPRTLPRMKVGGGMTQLDPPTIPLGPPPPPTARDEAPGGDEAKHPLAVYFNEASDHHAAAMDCGDETAAAEDRSRMRYALFEMRRRLEAARKAGAYSAVKPEDVQRQIKDMEEKLRLAEERRAQRARGICPTPLRPRF